MRLDTPEDIAEGCRWLAAAEPAFEPMLEVTGPIRPRHRPAGFPTLVHIILGQQVSVASARAVLDRMDAAGLLDPIAVAACTDDRLRDCGLSRQKLRYIRGLAESGLDFDGLDALPDEDLITELVRLPGIGLWSAEIYAMFALGRPDLFAAGDLALQEAARLIFDLPDRPAEPALRQMAEAWSPWRTVAATAMWQYYGVIKQREGTLA